jgi:hypothetical protein
MSHKFIINASFHSFLNTIDQELANEMHTQGCCYCGGKLHQANYPRSPVGLPPPFREYYDERLSFCCDACRKRATPPSVRFFGRRWFPALLFILLSVLMLGINERRILQVKQHFGIVVSESTWKRWRKWWRKSFMETPLWQQVKSLIPTISFTHHCLPRALLSAFRGLLEEKMLFLLRFLASNG